jgi:hypothetical protein
MQGGKFGWPAHWQITLTIDKLMAQLYEFVAAPSLEPSLATEIASVRGKDILPESRRCFVTGRYLNFDEYIEASKNPKGGHSKYHVGHIVPLTRGGTHAWDNIAWLSGAGNRIQGNDTLEEIEATLLEAVDFHLRRDMILDALQPHSTTKWRR